jgi:hypothetical protein
MPIQTEERSCASSKHEEWHVVHGDDEAGAYQAQLMTLRSLNAGPGTPVFGEVARSMRLVLRNRGAGPP